MRFLKEAAMFNISLPGIVIHIINYLLVAAIATAIVIAVIMMVRRRKA